MNKISDTDTKRAQRAVLKLIEKTASITDTDTLNKIASDILIGELGDKPHLVKRASEAYNSNKSIYKLANATDDTRGDSFALLDANKIYKEACDRAAIANVKKIASAGVFVAPRYFKIEQSTPIQKTASAPNTVKKAKFDTSTINVSTKTALYNRVCEIAPSCEGLFNKLASDESIAADKLSKALSEFKYAMNNASEMQRKEAASLLPAYYGVFGVNLLKRFNETPGVRKVASAEAPAFKGAVRLPNTDLFDAARKVRNANSLYKRASVLKTKAIDDMLGSFCKIIDTCLMEKKAAGGGVASFLAGTAWDNIIDNTPEALDAEGLSNADARQKLKSPELQHELRALELKRTFYDMMSDPYIAGFPVDNVLSAFNSAVSMLPVTEQGRIGAHMPLLRSWVTDSLSKGNVPSAADAEKVLRATEALEKLKVYEDDLHPIEHNEKILARKRG